MELAKAESGHNHNIIKGLWKGLVPFRIEIFSWFVLLGRLNTKSRLIRMNISQSLDPSCVLCISSSMEDIDHLFMLCPFSLQIWHWWINIWDLAWVFPHTIKEAYEQWHPPIKGVFFKKIWHATFFIILWSLWKERNARIFEGRNSSFTQTQDLVLLRLSWWIKGWGDPFPYTSEDILRNPSCLAWKTSTISVKPHLPLNASTLWLPPPSRSLKWNVDASASPSLLCAAIGGVLRDHEGKFICMFSTPIPFMEINNAEVLAIRRALKMSLSSARIKDSHIIIESDSKNAVNWCKQEVGGPWNLKFILNFIRNTASSEPGVLITHKSRGSNTVADSLAKQGLSRRDEFIAWV